MVRDGGRGAASPVGIFGAPTIYSGLRHATHGMARDIYTLQD